MNGGPRQKVGYFTSEHMATRHVNKMMAGKKPVEGVGMQEQRSYTWYDLTTEPDEEKQAILDRSRTDTCVAEKSRDGKYRAWYVPSGRPGGSRQAIGHTYKSLDWAKQACERHFRFIGRKEIRGRSQEARVRWQKEGDSFLGSYRGISLHVYHDGFGWAAEGMEPPFGSEVIGRYRNRQQAQSGAERWVKKNYGESRMLSQSARETLYAEIKAEIRRRIEQGPVSKRPSGHRVGEAADAGLADIAKTLGSALIDFGGKEDWEHKRGAGRVQDAIDAIRKRDDADSRGLSRAVQFGEQALDRYRAGDLTGARNLARKAGGEARKHQVRQMRFGETEIGHARLKMMLVLDDAEDAIRGGHGDFNKAKQLLDGVDESLFSAKGKMFLGNLKRAVAREQQAAALRHMRILNTTLEYNESVQETATARPEPGDGVRKSKGHLFFHKGYEWWLSPRQNVMRAAIGKAMDSQTGFRKGGREVMPLRLLYRGLLDGYEVPEQVWSRTITLTEVVQEVKLNLDQVASRYGFRTVTPGRTWTAENPGYRFPSQAVAIVSTVKASYGDAEDLRYEVKDHEGKVVAKGEAFPGPSAFQQGKRAFDQVLRTPPKKKKR